jgi:hypothetical protein
LWQAVVAVGVALLCVPTDTRPRARINDA